MKHIFYLILLFYYWGFSQTSLTAKLVESTPFDWDSFVGVDPFESLYFLKSNTLFKKNSQGLQNYSNLAKGAISDVSVFNALRLTLFYKDFNSVTLLDNRLAELISIDFNIINPLRTLSHISYGNDNSFWLFDSNTLQLELFDYNTSKTRVKTVPFQNEILALDSDYNNCWVLTEKELHCYNYIGSLISKQPQEGFTDLKLWNGVLFLQKENLIYYKLKNNETFLALNLPKILVKQFFVTNQTLYIYDEESLHHYQLLNN
tara:strand:- start:1070 stop:1849 length:780 start_codon:yes stop_codon:yes gene_type:complete